MSESIGIMEGAFFVGKSELLQWVNNTFKVILLFIQLNISKIEEACTGAIYCQIIDAIHPGEINMNKINWKAKLEHEFLNNFKLLQQVFNKCNINKNIDVERLIKGRYQENLEFLQFLKRYFDLNFKNKEYDAISKRKGVELVNPFNNQPGKSKDSKAPKKEFGGSQISNKPTDSKKENMKNFANIASGIEKETPKKASDTEEIKSLRGMVQELEMERDFYLSKLRDMEFLISNIDTEKTTAALLRGMVEDIIFSKVEIKVNFDENGCASVKPLNAINN